jgi:hypothetical protein
VDRPVGCLRVPRNGSSLAPPAPESLAMASR